MIAPFRRCLSLGYIATLESLIRGIKKSAGHIRARSAHGMGMEWHGMQIRAKRLLLLLHLLLLRGAPSVRVAFALGLLTPRVRTCN